MEAQYLLRLSSSTRPCHNQDVHLSPFPLYSQFGLCRWSVCLRSTAHMEALNHQHRHYRQMRKLRSINTKVPSITSNTHLGTACPHSPAADPVGLGTDRQNGRATCRIHTSANNARSVVTHRRVQGITALVVNFHSTVASAVALCW